MTKASEVLVRYRKPVIGVVLAMVIYTVLGFFAAPWLIKNAAVDYAAENLGTTLEIEKVGLHSNLRLFLPLSKHACLLLHGSSCFTRGRGTRME